MKRLYLLRHAKSSWDFPDLDDFNRPLNKRGQRDAPFMGKLLKKKKIVPDLIVSSPAVRAAVTARTIAENLEYSEKKLQFDPRIYDASASQLLSIIQEINESITSIILIGHNPSLTALANILSDRRIDNIPTCGFVDLDLDVKTWQESKAGCGHLRLFEYPKKHKKNK